MKEQELQYQYQISKLKREIEDEELKIESTLGISNTLRDQNDQLTRENDDLRRKNDDLENLLHQHHSKEEQLKK